jgi:methylated-DNA-protein-cysteine methyltransferase-like protein
MKTETEKESLYQLIYKVAKQVPSGKVATYGQVAKIVDRCSARQVGYAMAALPKGAGVPWHRIINHKGEISTRRNGRGHSRQRGLLKAESVCFDRQDRIDLERYGWQGPETGWLIENGFEPMLF